MITPFTFLATIIPGPNIFLAWNLYRLYGHVQAYRGAISFFQKQADNAVSYHTLKDRHHPLHSHHHHRWNNIHNRNQSVSNSSEARNEEKSYNTPNNNNSNTDNNNNNNTDNNNNNNTTTSHRDTESQSASNSTHTETKFNRSEFEEYLQRWERHHHRKMRFYNKNN